jgi:aspartyl-tRNA(Asn)/glutamyl-tRNA(Gln) amidotransferase subunit A
LTDLASLSAEDLLTQFRLGTASPVEALQAVTERIARVNPAYNAFAVLNPRAVAAAAESTQRWHAGRPIGPLDGVPCTVKDLVDLAGFPTRRGSRTSSPDPVANDAPLVVGLKNAGAVIVGKTTTTEFGWKSPGDCPLHGITRNPRNPAYTTGGSSSGAGAAAAAGFGPLHVGTDAGGSVRIPAAWCGVVGLKPSFGRIPQWPLGAFATVACAGPLARTVRDAALMLGAMAVHDWRDPFCLPGKPAHWRGRPHSWLHGIEDGVDGLRVAVLRNPGFDAPVDPDGIAAVEQAARVLSEAGAELEEVDPRMPPIGLPDTGHLFAQLWSTALRLVVANTPEDRRPLLDAGLMELAAMPEPSGTTMMQAAAQQVATAHAMAKLHQTYDLVLCPCVPGPPPLADAPTVDPVHSLLTHWAPWTFAFNLSRQPAISLPMGLAANGLPRSVQIAAAVYRDDLVLRAARTIEHAMPPLPPMAGDRPPLTTEATA